MLTTSSFIYHADTHCTSEEIVHLIFILILNLNYVKIKSYLKKNKKQILSPQCHCVYGLFVHIHTRTYASDDEVAG